MGKSKWVLARFKLSTYMHILSTHPQFNSCVKYFFVVANYLCLHLCLIFLKRDFICVVKFLEVKKSLILFVFYVDPFFYLSFYSFSCYTSKIEGGQKKTTILLLTNLI